MKSEVAKQSEAYRQKAELYDQLASQEEFVRQWNEHVKKVTEGTATPQEANELSKMKAEVDEMNRKIQMREMAEITDAFAQATDEKGNLLHPEFDPMNQIPLGNMVMGNQSEPFSLLRACVELACGNTPEEKLAAGYKSAKAAYDSIFEAGKKAGMGRLQGKMANSSLPPSSSSDDLLTMTDKKPKSAREALEMAKKGILVSR